MRSRGNASNTGLGNRSARVLQHDADDVAQVESVVARLVGERGVEGQPAAVPRRQWWVVGDRDVVACADGQGPVRGECELEPLLVDQGVVPLAQQDQVPQASLVCPHGDSGAFGGCVRPDQ